MTSRLLKAPYRAESIENDERDSRRGFRSSIGAFIRLQVLRSLQFGKNHKSRASILNAAFFSLFEACWSFFAVADRHQTIFSDALVDEKILCHLGPFCAQREVVVG